ncbi:MAG: phosphatase PAP2 family protein [Polaribacter sp.]|nr:phosphatase PAP2 family protein [Polaribacter sp.]MDG1811236.1 phosphatase PAP2 family protein [Polaribacter sp.]MDG1993843.1 phosphatase PAP2 family protein [Polaribacter sp.]
MNRLIKIDFLFLGFLFATTILLVCSWNQTENAVDLLITRGVILAISLMLILLNPVLNSNLFSLLRNSYPVIIAGYFYTETVYYNKLFFKNLDPIFIDFDESIFGFQPSLEFSRTFSSSWFSELMYFGYFSLFLIIISFVLLMYFKRKKIFSKNIFILSFSFFFFYFLFAIFPSAGPQFFFNEIDSKVPVNGYIFKNIMHIIQASAEQPTGAFPSSHVGISVTILILARKHLTYFFKICLPLVILLILSTVYIKAHYAVDAIFGLFITPIIVYLATIIYNYPSKKELIN